MGTAFKTVFFAMVTLLQKTKPISRKHAHTHVWLYRIVFSSRPAIVFALCLLISFVLQPVESALANAPSDTVTAIEVGTESENTEEGPLKIQVSSEPEIANELTDEPEEEVIAPVVVTMPANDETNTALTSAHEPASSIESEYATTSASVPLTFDSVPDGSNDGEPLIGTDEMSDVEDNVATTSDSVSPDPTHSEDLVTPTSTPSYEEPVDTDPLASVDDMESLPQSPVVVEAPSTNVSDDDVYQFARSACVAVGNGNYHCAVVEAGEASHENHAAVYAEVGSTGNKEIFFREGNEVVQITTNDYEDVSPHYDPNSRQIVWQRLLQGRYQIMQYSLTTASEVQLTDGATNHMQPAVSGQNVVWQEWDGNDWEIAYYNGASITRISDNEIPDIAPSLEKEYVIWTTVLPETQHLQVYSLTTQTLKTITDHEGGTVANPRFVLVYDTKFENGDMLTHTFDPESGVSMPVAATPAPQPVEIPPVEPTGETKALIQPKPAQKEKSVSDDDDATPQLDIATSTPVTASTSESLSDLVISEYSEETMEVSSIDLAEPVIEPVFELTDYDLIIEPLSATSAQLRDSE